MLVVRHQGMLYNRHVSSILTEYSDAFSKREKASEDYAIKTREREK